MFDLICLFISGFCCGGISIVLCFYNIIETKDKKIKKLYVEVIDARSIKLAALHELNKANYELALVKMTKKQEDLQNDNY